MKQGGIGRELQHLKDLILWRSEGAVKPSNVSLRGIAKLLVSEEELDRAIEESKTSLFNRASA